MLRDMIVPITDRLIGCPYVWGGRTPWDGFDCSGFVEWVYSIFGIAPEGRMDAQQLHDYFIHKPQRQNVQDLPGDLAFYGSDSEHISHVMLVIGDHGVVGAHRGGPEVTNFYRAGSIGAKVGTRLLRYRADFLCTVAVKFPDE